MRHAPPPKRRWPLSSEGPTASSRELSLTTALFTSSFALREEGVASIMINSNPETVTTDYDNSDKLFSKPVTLEDVLHVLRTEKPDGVVIQFGGQTPLNLARGLEAA
jgi:carbamoyl-phosphate synthase large subunit